MSPPPFPSTTRSESPANGAGPATGDTLKTRLDDAHDTLPDGRAIDQSQWIDCRMVDDRLVCERQDGRRVVVGPETIRTPGGKATWTGVGEIDVQAVDTETRRITRDASQTEIVLTPDRIVVTEPGVIRRTYEW